MDGLLVRHIDISKIVSILIIITGIAFDYAFRDIFYSFSFLGYMIVDYINHKNDDNRILWNYVYDFVFIPIVIKVVVVIVFHWL